jgi:AcrR family transcriptional regulator
MNREKTVKPLDRRILKTKKYLSEALIALILEKGYEAITIQDIINKANIGRSTFYAHFESKEQLLANSHQELNSLLFSVNGKGKKQGIDFLSLYTHAQNHSHVAKAMLGKKGGDIVVSHLREAMAFKILNEMRKNFGKGKTEQRMLAYRSEALASALIRLLTCWLEDDMPFTVNEMAKINEDVFNSTFAD